VKLPELPGASIPIVQEVTAAAKEMRLAERSRAIDLAPAFPRVEFRELGRRHLLGLRTSRALGGRGLDLPSVGLALFHLGHASGTTFAKLSLQPEFSSVLADHGGPDLVERYFRPLLQGEILVANQVTEPGAGSDAGALSMTARRDGEVYRLDGSKSEAAFAAEADAALVYARTGTPDSGSSGVTVFLVPQDLPGITRTVVGDLGERWMRRGRVHYSGVEVPATNRVGEEGGAFRYLQTELTRERALLAAIYLGVARASWEETVEHVGGRLAFGRPLSSQEGVSFPLVEDWVRLDAAGAFVDQILRRLEAGEAVSGEASLAKWLATDTALTAIDHAIQFHGGAGYSQALPHEQRWRDVRSGGLAHGSDEIMHLVAARNLWPRSG
jgi:cyclohexanecarboxyl-CoA dehydrogenase